MKGPKLPDMRRLRDPDAPRPPRSGLRRLRPRGLGRPEWLRRHEGEPRRRRRRRWIALPALEGLRVPDLNIPARLLVPGITAVVLLFTGGLVFGNMLGSSPSAAGTGLIKTTVTIKGQVVTLTGRTVKVTVRGKTVTRHGKTVRKPRRTITETQTQTQTQTHVRSVPTTVVRTVTKVRTVTVPTTETVTTTVTVPVT